MRPLERSISYKPSLSRSRMSCLISKLHFAPETKRVHWRSSLPRLKPTSTSLNNKSNCGGLPTERQLIALSRQVLLVRLNHRQARLIPQKETRVSLAMNDCGRSSESTNWYILGQVSDCARFSPSMLICHRKATRVAKSSFLSSSRQAFEWGLSLLFVSANVPECCCAM